MTPRTYILYLKLISFLRRTISVDISTSMDYHSNMENLQINWELFYNDIDQLIRIVVDPSDDTSTDYYDIGFEISEDTYSIIAQLTYPDDTISIDYAPGSYSIRRVRNDGKIIGWVPPKMLNLDTIITVYGNVNQLDDVPDLIADELEALEIRYCVDRRYNQNIDRSYLDESMQRTHPKRDGYFELILKKNVPYRVWIPYLQFNRTYFYDGVGTQISIAEMEVYEV